MDCMAIRVPGEAASRFAVGLGLVSNTTPGLPAGILSWLVQLGALGLLAWYFLKVEPQQRREEREARRREMEILLQLRDRKAEQ